MGPYICQKDTPLGKQWQQENPNLDTKRYNEKLFRLSTKMVALARIICGDVNIAATTALQAINPQGRAHYPIGHTSLSAGSAADLLLAPCPS
jgi:biotin synthase